MTSIPLVTPAADETYEYCVVEVPAELEAHFEKGDTSLLFNGRLSDEATLVTQDATYAVRQVSQSNSLLLCALEDNPQADGVHLRMRQNATDLLELVRTTPRLDRLPSLFEADAYTGQATESDEARHYTPAEVRSVVQASESELEVGLREHHILVLDGTYVAIQTYV
ncbi:Ctf8p and Ctf18p associating protein [Malassezia pachydermatis]